MSVSSVRQPKAIPVYFPVKMGVCSVWNLLPHACSVCANSDDCPRLRTYFASLCSINQEKNAWFSVNWPILMGSFWQTLSGGFDCHCWPIARANFQYNAMKWRQKCNMTQLRHVLEITVFPPNSMPACRCGAVHDRVFGAILLLHVFWRHGFNAWWSVRMLFLIKRFGQCCANP